MITITLQQILEHNPCVSGWRKVLEAQGGLKADYNKPFAVASILDSNGLDDTLWCLKIIPDIPHLWRKYAYWCASQVSHLTNDERVQACLDVVYTYSEGNASPVELLRAANSASRAVWAAAGAAAGEAAWADAGEAAWDAADADISEKLRLILNAGEWV